MQLEEQANRTMLQEQPEEDLRRVLVQSSVLQTVKDKCCIYFRRCVLEDQGNTIQLGLAHDCRRRVAISNMLC